MRHSGRLRTALVLAAVAGICFSATGCGYLKNVRDDLLDIGTLAVGIVPPVAPTAEGPKAVGFLPPAIGIYGQLTDLCHLGAIYKATGDLEWDRRGLGVMIDQRGKVGLGPLHWVYITQQPVFANGYKRTGNKFDGWRMHMDGMEDPIFGCSAKTLIFEPYETMLPGVKALPFLPLGWQDWEFISLEVAVPEPFILHTGIYVRAGVDPSQVFDFLLGLICVDLYSDRAFTFTGDLRFP